MSEDLIKAFTELARQNAEIMRQNAQLLEELRSRPRDTPPPPVAPVVREWAIRELWEIWEPWAIQHYKKSWRTKKYHKKALLETVIQVGDVAMKWGDMLWSQLTPATPTYYRTKREGTVSPMGRLVKGNSVNLEVTTLQSMLTWHVTEKRFDRNPIAGWVREDESKYRRRTEITLGEWSEFAGFGTPLFQEISWVQHRCMFRPGEVRKLLKSQVDWKRRIVILKDAKSGDREVPIPKDAFDIIDRNARASRGEYVFVTPSDPKRMAPIPATTFWLWLNNARKKSGKVGVGGERIVNHHARHGGVCAALETSPPRDVAAAAGMSLTTLDKVYAKYGDRQREKLREKMEQSDIAMALKILGDPRVGPQQVPADQAHYVLHENTGPADGVKKK